MHLYEALQQKVTDWRQSGYGSPDYPAVGEILEYASIPVDENSSQLRYLRAAQLQALETYWYLRVVEGTPHIFDLYRILYTGQSILPVLGLDQESIRSWRMIDMLGEEVLVTATV